VEQLLGQGSNRAGWGGHSCNISPRRGARGGPQMPDGREYSFEVTARSSADPATLFALEADGSRWSEWAKPLVPQSFWERTGDPAPGGVGAIRRLGLRPMVGREETVDY